MRDNFRKELNKMLHGRSGEEGKKKPKWIYFEAMSFLTDTITCRPSSGNIPMTDENCVVESQDDTISTRSDEQTSDQEEKDHANEDEEERNDEGIDEQSQNFRTPKGEKRVNKEKNVFKSKKKKIPNVYDRLLAVEEQKLDKLASMCSKTDKENTMDSNYMFLMSLLPHMKSLPPLRNMYMRQKIQELFIHEQEMLQSSITTTGRNTVEPSIMSPPGFYPSSSTSKGSTYSSHTPSPATYENNFTTVENDTQNSAQILTQFSNDTSTNIQRYFHTFN